MQKTQKTQNKSEQQVQGIQQDIRDMSLNTAAKMVNDILDDFRRGLIDQEGAKQAFLRLILMLMREQARIIRGEQQRKCDDLLIHLEQSLNTIIKGH